jgi:transposase-like protein
MLDKLPRRLHPQARQAIHGMTEANSREECTRQREAYCKQLRAQGHPDAAACLERDWDDFTRFYDFPEEHWIHLRTSNPIESVFSGVRLRTNAAKRMKVRENAAYLVFKLVMRLSTNWRGINGRNQIELLLAGETFVNGKLKRAAQSLQEGTAA